MWVLLGVGVVVIGFVARINPLLVIAAAAITTGLAAGMEPLALVAALGKAFNDNRYVSLIWIVLPVIGLLEREGLQELARGLITRVKAATPGRLLLGYFMVRQALAAVGLTSVGGHAQTVRPLLAPMTEAAAEQRHGPLDDDTRNLVRAHAAAVDNIALFFGEDIFLAIASILLIKGFLEQNGVMVEPLQLSIWAIPSAIAALGVHAVRLRALDRRLGMKGAVA
ncbi:DUF969 domain-containing protein [Niveispirillum cyanobacteriorum]|uniref:DUF969 domain-containing protein n=1 Tax=Niveispirillum cyanobacteriorum TaxID=1612173 RepID=A0A2K9NLE9_9PROT|nr:DUF969 domain-containing protein [Niveispirillum cyanobacteriorum]AUN33863.1 DUF969 domain-containing protein [Niveispirillum cyanobacteriorum]GGE82159.1 membrane protein [Niveispirillum cyanobacteriorum]